MNKKFLEKKLPIGTSDFKTVIEENNYFVDKSLFIKEIIDTDERISLIPRPRRFGKTLNLSMLKHFFQKTDFLYEPFDSSSLFKNLKIWQENEKYKENCGKYPVAYITFKDVKDLTWENCYDGIVLCISNEFSRHSYLLETLSVDDKNYFEKITSRTASEKEFQNALRFLSEQLAKHYGEKTIILIDEYDMPILAGYTNNYYDKIVDFMKNFLSAGMKDNEFLQKSVFTGILRVAKESIFSGLNNVEVASILSHKYQDKFGFTEEEVIEMLQFYEVEYDIKKIRDWYNGFIFGKTYIYNPWSILELISNEMSFRPWWINTSSNDIIRNLITTADANTKKELEDLIKRKPIETVVDDSIVYRNINKNATTLWNFMLFTGYLKIIDYRTENLKKYCKLVIPNNEVQYIFEQIITNWFDDNIQEDTIYLKKALLEGDVSTFHLILIEFANKTFSFFDVKGTEPERFYHGFVLGMIAHLNDVFDIKSNRESGKGRYDVMLIPKDKSMFGTVFEFKKVETAINETFEKALASAKKQIIEKNYKLELENKGVKNIKQIAIAFEGKKIKLQEIN